MLEGVEALQRLRGGTGHIPVLGVQIDYNESNAWAALHRIEMEEAAEVREQPVPPKNDHEEAGHSMALQKQKTLLQSVLLRRADIPSDLLSQVLTNYANCLDHLNRTFEAIDVYIDCLEVVPHHGLAMANCGEAIRRAAALNQTHANRNALLAYRYLSRAAEMMESIRINGGPAAIRASVKRIETMKAELEEAFGADFSKVAHEHIHHLETEHSTEHEDAFKSFAVSRRLLLTANQAPKDVEEDAVDDLYFATLVFDPHDEKRLAATDLINIYNSIKEEYITARYLFYLSSELREELACRSAMTVYGDPQGDGEFGLLSGTLKTSLALCLNLYDKIAVFLSRYLGLEVGKRAPSFSNVWFSKLTKSHQTVHPKIEASVKDNPPLAGLMDMRTDLLYSSYPGPTKKLRDRATHEGIKLSYLPGIGRVDSTRAWSIDDFKEIVVFSLRQAKAAILLLTGAVELEEQNRKQSHQESGKMVIPEILNLRKPISSRALDEVAATLQASEEDD